MRAPYPCALERTRTKPRAQRPISARDAAHQRLREEAHRYPDLGLEPLDTKAIGGPAREREAALAHAIYDAVMRRWITLEAVLAPHSSRPMETLDSTVRAALLAGAAQLLLLERVPPHAAIHEAVQWTRRAGKPKATGLVNALLRRVSEGLARDEQGRPLLAEGPATAHVGQPDRLPLADGRALQLTRGAFPTDTLGWLERAVGLPRWLVERWAERFGEAAAVEQALHTLCHAPVVLNIAHAAAPVQPPEGQSLTPHERAGLCVLGPAGASPREILRGRGDVWVQDAAAAGALDLLAPWQAGERAAPAAIVDLCAGLGTKTRQLRAMFPEASIHACDTNAARAKGLRRVFGKDERTHVLDIDAVRRQAAGKADLVLLDVPCSNSGVLPRRPEARYRMGGAQLERLTALQRELLLGSKDLLAPGGMVLYSTCSIDDEENGGIVRWAVEEAGFDLLGESMTMPAGLPGQPTSGYRDGGYAALLARAVCQDPVLGR